MATTEELKKITLMCFDNDNFRNAMEKDPLRTAASVGIAISPQQAYSITNNVVNANAVEHREAKSIFFPLRLK